MFIESIMGMSLDARIDWLSNVNDLQEIFYGIVMQYNYDAMLCGSTTMLKAQYDENNNVKYSNQTLVVVDSEGKINNWQTIRKQAWYNDNPIVLCSNTTPIEYIKNLEKMNISYIISGERKVDLVESINILESKYNIKKMRIDSGGVLLGKMLRKKLVNKITTVITPQLTGGNTPQSIFCEEDLKTIDEVIHLKLESYRQVKDNFMVLTYNIMY